MADGKVVIDVILEDGRVAKGVAKLDKSIVGLASSGRKAASGIKEIAVSLGIVSMASKAINSVTNALDGAISRYDTLNNFPKVMQMIGFSADDSQKAINRLSDGIQGLPTTLDDVASTAQRLAVMTGDLDGSVETTLALNNAFLSSGASAADASRGLEQYVQMLATGTVDLQSWRTLQETMGVALNDVAEAFGFAGESAQNDLFKALQSGNITFSEFNDKLIELSNATGGFADRAKVATGGIRTAWSIMNTSIVRGVTNIIEAIDEVLAGTRWGSIEQILKNMGDRWFNVLDSIAEGIRKLPAIIDSVTTALEPWAPLLKNIAGLALSAVAGLMAFKSVLYIQSLTPGIIKLAQAISLLKNPIFLVQYAWLSLTTAFMANPIAWVTALIAGLAAMFIYLWKTNDGFREALTNTWSKIVGLFQKAQQTTKELAQSFKDFFSQLKESLNIDSVIGTLIGPLTSVASLLLGLASPIGWLIKGIAMLATQTTFFTDVLKVFKGELSFGELVNNLASDLATLITSMSEMTANMIIQGSNAIAGFLEGFSARLPEVVNAGVTAITGFIEGVSQNLPQLLQSGSQITLTLVTAIVSALPDLMMAAAQIIQTLVTTFVSMLPQLIQTYMTLMTTLIQTITTMLPLIIEAIITLVMTIVQAIIDNLPLIINAGIQILMALIEGVISILPALIQAFITILDAIIKVVIDNLPLIIAAGIQILEALIKGIISILPQLIQAAIKLILTLAQTLIKNLPTIIKAGIDILLAIIKGIINMLPELISTGIDLIIKLASTLIKSLPEIIKAGIEIILSVIKGIGEALPDLLKKGTEVIKDLASTLKTKAPDLLKKVGKAVVEGLWSGIKGAGDWLKRKVSGFFSGIVDWGKKALGINSPARVIRDEIGKWIPPGVGVGIDRNKEYALEAMRDLKDDLIAEGQVDIGVRNRLRGVGTPFNDLVTHRMVHSGNSELIKNMLNTITQKPKVNSASSNQPNSVKQPIIVHTTVEIEKEPIARAVHEVEAIEASLNKF